MNKAKYVDTSIGTVAEEDSIEECHGGGKTYPGASVPGGMVQLSPDTVTGGDNGSGYNYCHNTIEGFSFNHMSGIGWYGDLGNLPYYTLMFGTVDRDTFIETGKFSTTLNNLTYIIKAELQLPSTHPDGNYDYNIISVKIRANRSDSPAITPSLIGTGSMDFIRAYFGPNSKIALQTYLGKIKNNGEVMGVYCQRSSKVSVYFIGGFCYPEPALLSGDKLEITAYYLDGSLNEKTLTATKQFNRGISINDGYMYTISADLN